MSILKKLFGGTSVDLKALVKEGAMIIDVRSPAEFNRGHIKGAVNRPLQAIQSSFNKKGGHWPPFLLLLYPYLLFSIM